MIEELLVVEGLQKTFDGIRALSGFSCSLCHGEILGLIGPNGAGKTTLLNVICGFLAADAGEVKFRGRDLLGVRPHKIALTGIARTFQKLRIVTQISVLDNVLLCFRQQPGEKLGNLVFRWKAAKEQEATNREEAIRLLDETGLLGKAYDLAEELSYGEQKLLTLVCCLAAKGDLLLLDEPVAGISPGMISNILRIIRELPNQNKSVVLIEHNIDAVMQVCDRVIFMDAGSKVSEGSPQQVRDDPRVIEAYMN